MNAHEVVLSRLEAVRKSGEGWTARCPAHDDRTPSLSIAVGNDGRVLLYCFTGCAPEEVARALGLNLRDLFPEGSDWKAPSEEDRELLRRRADEARAARLVETARQHEEAAGRAAWILRQCGPAPADHPYPIAKQVSPGNARIGRENRLVLPVTDLQGNLWSLQFIGPDGGKRFLRGGRIRGCMIPVAGEMPGASRILLCEGWATGMTLAAVEPDALVLAALNAGNLEPVAVAVRRQWPDTEIVVCCDADPVGIEHGRSAAIAAGAQVAIPEFPAGVEGSDFNDLAAAMRRKVAA